MIGRVQSEGITLFWKRFGESSIDFPVNVWLEYTQDHRAFIAVKNTAIKNLKKAFDENGIRIPFPIRALDFQSQVGSIFNNELRKKHA